MSQTYLADRPDSRNKHLAISIFVPEPLSMDDIRRLRAAKIIAAFPDVSDERALLLAELAYGEGRR